MTKTPWMARIFPPRCLLCGDPGAHGRALCAGCDADLPRLGPACIRCAEPLPATAPGRPELTVCGACLWRPPPFAAIEVPFRYAAPIDWLVRRRDLAAGRLLGELVQAAVIARLPPVDAVVAVPLHGRRLCERGFNQANEIAGPLARRLGLAPIVDGLRRPYTAPAQMDLPAGRRRANVRGAFVPGTRAPAGTIVLVDDVVTTASTVREAARTLLRGGAADVHIVAVARA